jgi:hypothetical protein
MSHSTETMIWSSINDTRNQLIIDKEISDFQNFVPKTSIAKDNSSFDDDEEVITDQTIDEIILVDYSKFSTFEILKNQLTVMTYLGTRFRTNDMESTPWEFYKKYLVWILESSSFITHKFNIPVQIIKSDEIIRSSYKFCSLRDKCIDNYGNPLGYQVDRSKQCRCSGDHFVHNKIVQDLTCLITILDKTSETLHDDLRIGLSTIIFVIRHMYQELEVFNVYLKDSLNFNIDNYYCVKTKDKKRQEQYKTRPQNHHTPVKSTQYKDKKPTNAFSMLQNDSDSDN